MGVTHLGPALISYNYTITALKYSSVVVPKVCNKSYITFLQVIRKLYKQGYCSNSHAMGLAVLVLHTYGSINSEKISKPVYQNTNNVVLWFAAHSIQIILDSSSLQPGIEAIYR